MPQLVGYALAFVVSNVSAIFGASVAFQAVAAQFAAGLGGLVFGAGLLFAQSLLSQRPGSAPTITPANGQQSIRQDVPSRTRSYGKIRRSGPVWWFASVDDNFYLGLALNTGEVNAFLEHFLDDAQVVIDDAGDVQTAPYVVDSVSKVNIQFRYGVDAETAYSEIEAAFGVANVRGDGVTSALIIYTSVASDTFRSLYPTGGPCTYRATLETSKIWDPRDPAQDRLDKSTWQFSDNPALCTLDYMLHPQGYNVPYERIEPNIHEWRAAADNCDVLMLKSDGTYEKRYTLAFTYSFDDNPKDVLSRLLSSFDGWISQKLDGTLGIEGGVYIEPSGTIDAKYILGWQLTAGPDPVSGIAAIRSPFLSREHDYRSVEAQPWPDGDTALAAGDNRSGKLDLSMCPSHSQARRLMKRAFLRASTPIKGTVTTMLYGMKAYNKRRYFFDLTPAGLGVVCCEIQKATLDTSEMSVSFDIVQIGSEIDDWTPSEEGTPPEDPAAIESSTLEAPTNFDVTIASQVATATWDSEPAFSHEVSYKKAADSTWTTVPVTAGQDSVIISGLAASTSYNFRVRSIGGTGTASPWSATVTKST